MKNQRISFTKAGIAISIFFTVQETNGRDFAITAPTKADISISDTSRIHDLDEIIVVSQSKESTLLRHQPMASSIFTSEETTNLGINDICQLSAYVPSFQMPAYGSRLTSSMYIRGIGSRINNPAVGIYLDGMPLLSKSAFNSHIYQIYRADVLRGPQGTLYGMNTEGGLVRIYSKSPLSHNGTYLKLGIGNRMTRNAEIANYLKLSENTGISLAGFYSGQNGFFKNSTTGKRADNIDEAGGKIRITNQYSSRLTLDFIADYQYVRQAAFPYGELDITNNHTASPSMNRESGYKRNMLNTGFNATYTMSNWALNYNASYQFLTDRMDMDQDYCKMDYMHLRQKQLQNGITQELVLKGTNSKKWRQTTGLFSSYLWNRTEAPVYFDSDFTNNMANTIQNAMSKAIEESIAKRYSMIPGITEDEAKAMAQKDIERLGGISVDELNMSVPGLFHTPQLNIGIFHESQINITPKLTMTVGLRYDFSRMKIDYATSASMKMNANVMGNKAGSRLSSILRSTKSNSFNQVLPKLGFTWQFDNNASNIYVLVNKGYRQGGFNIQMFSDILQTELRANSNAAMRKDYDIPHSHEDYERINNTIEYKPELSWNYEVGTHLNLFNNMMQADFSVYYTKIRNQQLSVMAGTYGFGRMMINSGRSHSCGLEASLRGRAIDNRLSWAATYSMTRSKFDNYKDNINGKEISFKGKNIPFVPQNTLSGTADWTTPIKNGFIKKITVGANCTAQGKTYWDESNSFRQDFYATLGAHADIFLNKASVSLWGKNLTSTDYNTFALKSSATGKPMYLAQRGNPIQIGIDVNIKL